MFGNGHGVGHQKVGVRGRVRVGGAPEVSIAVDFVVFPSVSVTVNVFSFVVHVRGGSGVSWSDRRVRDGVPCFFRGGNGVR